MTRFVAAAGLLFVLTGPTPTRVAQPALPSYSRALQLEET